MAEAANPTHEDGVFQLGLVMAGAVSAGAYTAGMLDFLIEAMDAWEAAKAAGEDVPTHSVRLRALAGASAGAMCAAILAAIAHRRFAPARPVVEATEPDGSARITAPPVGANPLYDAWVRGPDIAAMLDTTDLADGVPLRSALNVGVLQRIVDDVLDFPAEARPRGWIAPGLPVAFAVGNLRGVPYGVTLGGGTGAAYKMLMHQDAAAFTLAGPARPGFSALPAVPASGDAGWSALGQAALASGAFPVALRARALKRDPATYAARQVQVPGDGFPGSTFEATRLESLAPDWPKTVSDPYHYLCVDGGVFDNEPLELCRALMLDPGKPTQRMVRDGRFADRSVIMVDPFPDTPNPGPDSDETSLPKVAEALIEAWKMQCRFGAVDVALAVDRSVYSRHLLAPSRKDAVASGAPLAAGGLGAFLGFFHEAFRHHDFYLGRRNCQRFLQQHLALPVENRRVFRDDQPGDPKLAETWAGVPHRPVVPLVGTAAAPQPLPCWPAGALDPAKLRPAIRGRMNAVFDHALEGAGFGLSGRLAARAFWMWKRGGLTDEAMGKISDALTRKQLN